MLTKWVSSLTFPHNPDVILYICLDTCNLNKAITQEHFKAPTLNESFHWLNGAIKFSKLDAKDDFWSIHLDEKCSYPTTFNTHKVGYQFLRVSFGLKMSQNIFQRHMDQITIRLPGILVIHEKICLYSCTSKEHDRDLLQLMQEATRNGLVFNSSKFRIRWLKLASIVQSLHPKVRNMIPLK